MDDYERVALALDGLDGKIRRDAVKALEALAEATEMISTGGSAPEVVVSGGFESSVPGELHLLAAEVVREGRRSLRAIVVHAAKLKRRQMGERPAGRYALPKPGRPSVVTISMVNRARQLRATKHSVTATVRLVALEYGVSERALWKAKERGETSSVGNLDYALYQALQKLEDV